MRFVELVGVYHADGSLLGELRYAWGKLWGTAHCALCDITHGAVSEKPAFKALEERLPIPLKTVHLDERSADLVEATEGRTPCVVGQAAEGWEVVLDAEALESCQKSVEAFESLLLARLEG